MKWVKPTITAYRGGVDWTHNAGTTAFRKEYYDTLICVQDFADDQLLTDNYPKGWRDLHPFLTRNQDTDH